jgi:hypothetical protein
MDATRILARAKEALGAERDAAASALTAASRSRKRRMPTAPPSQQRARKQQVADRPGLGAEGVRDVWRGFVFSTALDALWEGSRDRGSNEKITIQTMQKQRGWIGSGVRTHTLAIGVAGHEFVRSIWAKYERSITRLRIVGHPDKDAGDEFGDDIMRCAITKAAVGAASASRVVVSYRCSDGIIRDSSPIVMTREWAERTRAWHVIVSLDDRIAELARVMFADLEAGELKLPVDVLKRWNQKRQPAVAQLVAQDEDLFRDYRRAVARMLPKTEPNVWSGWFEE